MSEAWGNVILNVSDELNAKLLENKRYVESETIAKILEYAGLSSNKFQGEGFSIQGVKPKAGYINLDIFGGEWIPLARELATKGSKIELYSSLYDEYGTNVFCALNSDGDKFDYWFEEEGDEWDQDGFDEKEFRENIKTNRKKWLSLIPEVVKKYCPELISQGGDIKNETYEIFFDGLDRYQDEIKAAKSWLDAFVGGNTKLALTYSKTPFFFRRDNHLETDIELEKFYEEKHKRKGKELPEHIKLGLLKTNMEEQYNLPEDTVVIVLEIGDEKAALFVEPGKSPGVFGILTGREFDDLIQIIYGFALKSRNC